jgi:hypothetical protein
MRARARWSARAALLLAAATAGCRSDAPPAAESGTPTGVPQEILPAPRLSVGVLEGDTLREFSRVVTPFVLPDGALAVPLGQARVIRVFDRNGAFVRTLGRPGEGPGEFASLDAAWSRGDTIEAFDGLSARVTRFLPDGTSETVPLESVRSAQGMLGVLGEGWALYGVASVPPGGRDQMRVHRFSRSGAHLGELGALEGMLRFSDPTAKFSGPTPLSPKWLLAGHANHVFIAESMEPLIRVVDSAGTVLREISWQPDPSPGIDATLRAVIDSAVNYSMDGMFRSSREQLEAAPAPDRLSVAWGLIVDAEGFAWVRPYDPMRNAVALGGLRGPGKGGAWLIFSPEGERVGEVTLPDELEPTQITTDAVAGIVRDELGVETVRVYPLTRR